MSDKSINKLHDLLKELVNKSYLTDEITCNGLFEISKVIENCVNCEVNRQRNYSYTNK